MFATFEAERRAAGSRALVVLGAVCVLSGLVLWGSYEHASASVSAPAHALYVPPVGLRPAAASGQQTMPAASPSVMATPGSTEALRPTSPETPVAPAAVMPVMPAAPAEPEASPLVMIPMPAQEPPNSPTRMFSGFFFGLSASFAMGVAIMGKRIYDQKSHNSGDLELGALQPSATAFQPTSVTFASRARAPAMMAKTLDLDVQRELVATAKAICAPGKGILAGDESTMTIGNRFEALGVENTRENRVAYREMMIRAPGLEEHISGMIMFEEALFDSAADGTKFVDLLNKAGIIPGIKTDTGVRPLPGSDGENFTQGFDNYGDRAKGFYAQGARFCKWRNVLVVDKERNLPSELSIQECAYTLAKYAAFSQENKLVPIVEPEILQDGTHDVAYTAAVTEKVLAAVFKALNDYGVLLEGCLLKPNMVTPGSSCTDRSSPEEIAALTVRSLNRTVPPALCGVTFLSGGSSEEDASVFLNIMNKNFKTSPTALTFSYGRALQKSALETWAGKAENVKAAQEALMARAKANGEASKGEYAGGAAGSTESLFQKGYVY